jgi:D-glycero-alpha-D-manno-heptose-7-phosphate kinase
MANDGSTAPLIVTRTPLRVSFVGGGTDLPAFYTKESGAVLSTAITQYVYVTIKRHSELYMGRPDGPGGGAGAIRITYSKTEEVAEVDEVENDIARECLRFLEVGPPIYISTVGDVPASTGLGGSSAFCVGLLNALHAYKGERVSAGQLADEACHIEIDVLGEPIGKQDQFAAAFGGLNVLKFNEDGGVTVQHQRLTGSKREELFGSMLMFWTGHQRDASEVLAVQQKNTEAEFDRLRRMRDQVDELAELTRSGELSVESLGDVLHEGWQLKRKLAAGISSDKIDGLYERAIAAGACGGKLCGAGGGGFLLFVVSPEHHESVRAAMGDLQELVVGHEVHGSQVVVPFNQ